MMEMDRLTAQILTVTDQPMVPVLQGCRVYALMVPELVEGVLRHAFRIISIRSKDLQGMQPVATLLIMTAMD
jgi:hypothetical protein